MTNDYLPYFDALGGTISGSGHSHGITYPSNTVVPWQMQQLPPFPQALIPYSPARVADMQVTPKEEGPPMRGLYRVFIVNPKTDEILLRDNLIIAKDEATARLRAVMLARLEGEPEDYDFIVDYIGAVRAKEKPQRVIVEREG